MKKTSMRILVGMSLLIASSVVSAQTTASPAQPVTVDNYNRAQTDVYFAGVVKNGGFGKFRHGRELAPPVQQGIVRPNRDTLYSFVIVDLDAGPVTITLPDAGKRFMGMQVANEDQYTWATYYGAGSHGCFRWHSPRVEAGARHLSGVGFRQSGDVRAPRSIVIW